MFPKNPFQELQKESEIKEFYENYKNALREINVKNPEGVAQRHLGYLVPINNSTKVVKKWTRIIPEIKPVPYLGKNELKLLEDIFRK